MIKINKKLAITACFMSFVIYSAIAAMPQQQQEEQRAKNLKVLPKNLTHKQIDKIMDEWKNALGVRCNFCHARNAETNKMDFASDAKPEKLAAREMFKMTAKINSKFFKAKKDSLGMMTNTGISCVTCHHGTQHPEGGQHHEEGEKK